MVLIDLINIPYQFQLLINFSYRDIRDMDGGSKSLPVGPFLC